MRGVVRNKAAFWLVKGAAAVVPMLLAERMWRKHRVGAVVMMVLVNGTAVAVAMNNARVLERH